MVEVVKGCQKVLGQAKRPEVERSKGYHNIRFASSACSCYRGYVGTDVSLFEAVGARSVLQLGGASLSSYPRTPVPSNPRKLSM